MSDEEIDAMAYRLWSIHPKDVPEPVGMPEGYRGGARAWFYATEIRRIREATVMEVAMRIGGMIRGCDETEYEEGYNDAIATAERYVRATLAEIKGKSHE